MLNGRTVSRPIILQICQIISTTEISDRANFSYALHKKFTSWCPTTPFWVEALFYLCCVGTGTGYLPPVHTNHSDTPEAWIGNSVSNLNWTQILHKYFHTFSNITQIFTHFLQVLMVYKDSPKYQENWNKEYPTNKPRKTVIL